MKTGVTFTECPQHQEVTSAPGSGLAAARVILDGGQRFFWGNGVSAWMSGLLKPLLLFCMGCLDDLGWLYDVE